MCGIAGLIAGPGFRADPGAVVRAMTDTLVHRGPDGSGVWLDARGRIAFGHRRLAIVDLSAAGAQPMCSASGRYTITFNGEVYNFPELRAELEKLGAVFRGHSDTEVMLAAFEAWGIVPSVERFLGMFAFAVWDAATDEVTLVRDRLGKKPLYYYWSGTDVAFGSELKALCAFPGLDRTVDRGAIAQFLRYSYVPAPYSILTKVRKVEAGGYVRFALVDGKPRAPTEGVYWSAIAAARRGQVERFAGDEHEATAALGELLRDATRMRMVADVPLGAFLSGGIDSSLIVAMMQSQSTRPIRTFTIGFHEKEYNEADHARAVAKHLGTEHTEVIVTPEDALGVIPRLPAIYDEPMSDPSEVPTFLVCEMARRHVTVALSGDGGDELFHGYGRYDKARSVWRKVRRLPVPVRSLAAHGLRAISADRWDQLVRMAGGGGARVSSTGMRLHKLAEAIGARTPAGVYRHFLTHWSHPASIVIGAHEPPTKLALFGDPGDDDAFSEQMCLIDAVTYLPDEILVKVDRASMAVSLEARAPLLDHRVFEFAASLPLALKRGPLGSKHLLRRLLYQSVPRELVEREKMGFGVPIDLWLRGPLRDWAEDLLSEQRLRRDGFLDPVPIRRVWRAHLEARGGWHNLLWDVLMFQAWWAEFERGVQERAVA